MRCPIALLTTLAVLGAPSLAQACPISRAVLRYEDGRVFKANGYAAIRVRSKQQVDFCRPHCGYEASVIRGTINGRTAYLWTEVSSGMSVGWWATSRTEPRMPAPRREVALNWRARALEAERFGLKGTPMTGGPVAGTIQEVRCAGR